MFHLLFLQLLLVISFNLTTSTIYVFVFRRTQACTAKCSSQGPPKTRPTPFFFFQQVWQNVRACARFALTSGTQAEGIWRHNIKFPNETTKRIKINQERKQPNCLLALPPEGPDKGWQPWIRKCAVAAWGFALCNSSASLEKHATVLAIRAHAPIIPSLHSQKTKPHVSQGDNSKLLNTMQRQCRGCRTLTKVSLLGIVKKIPSQWPKRETCSLSDITQCVQKNAALCKNKSTSFFQYNFFFPVQTPYLCVDICFVNACSFLKRNCWRRSLQTVAAQCLVCFKWTPLAWNATKLWARNRKGRTKWEHLRSFRPN